ncbi:heat shock protein DnaJ domain protein [Anaeromyxobacter dehalogenans 2CP-1]|uniref:Heat shock protein DnaJ domain protein n=1 Tax=Anaeromyxobacter dehalogenans (strain ATCC BAA-258 / DSM 21875 / 2CP-1) TaxID=455488 RepID=B8JAP8_ANAD2|nr:DnaJ domain-containing protein [Anaeromyxobacter dehalogenans]ACL67547.1 heat shock protein DnaJ domain protein [Anaeromyxobacter dehalogenans 2CP-1]
MARTVEVSLEEVVAAGRVLFGPGFAADQAGWRDALKAAYRRRALETHPDRARATGRPEHELAREFRAVSEAYRVLSALRGPADPGRARRPRPAPAAGPARPARRAPGAGARSEAPPTPRPRPAPSTEARRAAPTAGATAMPQRRLRLAEFLFHAGAIPWTAFVEAVAWQRAQRPPLGRLAVDWGFLRREDVARILELRRAGGRAVPFGEVAVRHGYLTSFQLLALLGRQLRQQRRIGEYFVERGLVTPAALDELRRRMALHNARFAP